MQIEFVDEELARFYEGEKVKNKELKSSGNLQKLFIKAINRLKSLDKIEDAFLFHSLSYEKLQGNLAGKSSVRVDIKYRIIFKEVEDQEGKVVILSIEELSNHYQ